MYDTRIIESLNLQCEEADALESCMVATPDGMVDLVLGIAGTPSGQAGASRINERGALESYFDGTGDQFNFGSANTINIASDFTIVYEVYFDGMGGANDAYPGIAIFARGASDPFRLGYSTDAGYDDIYFGTRGGTQHAYLLPSGLTKTLQRHFGVVSYTAGTGYSVWVNGQACTSTTSGSLAVITDDTRIGGTSGTTSDVLGGIRQVRRYSRAWTEAEAVRAFANKDRLYRPKRGRLFAFAVAAGSDVSGVGAITEAGDTLNSAAAVSVQATGATTEAGDTLSSAATVNVAAAGAVTEAGDTLSSAATASVQATSAVTEAGDSLSSAGAVTVQATGAITEAGDSLSADGVVGTAPVQAAGAVTEVGDTASGAGTVLVQASGAVTEAGDTASGAGTVPVQAAGVVTEAGDTALGAGAVTSTGTVTAVGAITEAGDTLAASVSTGVFVVGNSAVFYARARATTWTSQPKATTWTARRAA